eukprot:gb/GEZJ01005442.1/.p2 GENE.gb/GEZJ01005442.1/~~gb/GEZJ01005442.1/.p2  ORF type:complete len:160 (+),score=7.79 gb/GEZJ01005442.1/:902-1381(+)
MLIAGATKTDGRRAVSRWEASGVLQQGNKNKEDKATTNGLARTLRHFAWRKACLMRRTESVATRERIGKRLGGMVQKRCQKEEKTATCWGSLAAWMRRVWVDTMAWKGGATGMKTSGAGAATGGNALARWGAERQRAAHGRRGWQAAERVCRYGGSAAT